MGKGWGKAAGMRGYLLQDPLDILRERLSANSFLSRRLHTGFNGFPSENEYRACLIGEIDETQQYGAE